jgi:predicted ATPase
MSGAALQLRRVELRSPGGVAATEFPFSVPAIATLEPIDLTTAVTFFVGENGSGKSTLMEGIAVEAGLPAVGSQPTERDATLSAQRLLARRLKLTWGKRNHRGFFLRAEDFFGFARAMSQLRVEMLQRIKDVERDYRDASAWSRGLATGPAAASLADMERMYGQELDARSHGESFLRLFQSRLVPNGVFLLDEPEAALSPQSQLALMAMIAETVAEGSQFVIATHAPILLAYPGATIYSFDRTPIAPVSFEELDHVTLTRSFLNDPERYLRHLFP